jgi:hypothetical protein
MAILKAMKFTTKAAIGGAFGLFVYYFYQNLKADVRQNKF